MAKLTKSYKEHLSARLQDPAQAAGYINAVLEEGDVEAFLLALRDVADARGIGKVAKAAGLNRENIYRILSDQGNPRLSSMVALLQAIGVQLQVKPSVEAVAEHSQHNFAVVKPTLLKDECRIAGRQGECAPAHAQLAGRTSKKFREGVYATNEQSAAA